MPRPSSCRSAATALLLAAALLPGAADAFIYAFSNDLRAMPAFTFREVRARRSRRPRLLGAARACALC